VHWVRSRAATGELRFSKITERPIPLRNRNVGKVQAARPPVHLQPEDFSTYVPAELTNVSQSQRNDNTDRIVAQVIAAMTPLLEASEVRITANMKDIHISLLSKIADLNKIVQAQDKRIAALEREIKSNRQNSKYNLNTKFPDTYPQKSAYAWGQRNSSCPAPPPTITGTLRTHPSPSLSPIPISRHS
jgi:hypothetical protein